MAAVTRVQKDTGSTIKPGPMLVAGPEQVVTDADLTDVAAGTGLNGPFLADLLAAAAAHENDGKNLFQALGHMTANPALQARYKQFREESVVAVQTYELLAAQLCVANVSLFEHIAEGLPDGEAKAAFAEHLPPLADTGARHLVWAASNQRAMVTSQASSRLVQ